MPSPRREQANRPLQHDVALCPTPIESRTDTRACHGTNSQRRQWAAPRRFPRLVTVPPVILSTRRHLSPNPKQSPSHRRHHHLCQSPTRPQPHTRAAFRHTRSSSSRRRRGASPPTLAASSSPQPTPHAPPATHHHCPRHGGEQQHHCVRDAAGADLRGAGHRVGDLVRVGTGGGVRAPGALARGHPGRAPPPGRARRLRRRVLEPPPPAGLLPRRHGRAHRAPHRAARLGLRRHPRVRGVPRAGTRLRGLPPRRLLHVAARVRLRRPGAVGEDQGVPRGIQHLQEARAAGRLRQRRTVLPDTNLAAPVRLLQASFAVRLRVREPDGVDEPVAPVGGPGLRAVEQRPRAALLQLRVVQGRPPGGAARPVAQGQHRARRRHRRARHPLPRRLQRLQERAGGVALPPVQVVKRLLASLK